MNTLQKLLIAFCCTFVLPAAASAALPRISAFQDGSFSVRISLNSADPVNAYDLALSYPSNLVEILRIDTSRSIVTILAKPIKAKDGEIVIKGGSTTPFTGADGEIATIYLRPIAAGTVNLTLTKGLVYAADGQGTALSAQFSTRPIAVTTSSLNRYEVAAGSGTVLPADTEPPRITSARLEVNPLESDAPPLIILEGADSETGIREFRVRTVSWAWWSPWQEAINPYPLSGGEWAIEVMAIDNSANVATTLMYRPSVAALKLGALAVLAVGAWFGLRRLRRAR